MNSVFIPFLLMSLAAPTPAQRRIETAEAATARDPKAVAPRVDLAMALSRRARETSDPAFYARALDTLGQAEALSPGDYQVGRARVWALLGQHRFADARNEAQALNKRAPDDLLVYGLLGDAHLELGEYPEAEEALQWMMNLRPGNVAGLTRAAYFRELIGDADGALEFMGDALERTSPDEVEDRAWIDTQIAHLHLATGRVALAEAAAQKALDLFPDYHYALAQLAGVRAAQGLQDEAVTLLRKRYALAPHPENLYDVGRALERAGRVAEAQQAFAEFEQKARGEMAGADNCNRELAAYYVDEAHRPEEGLRVAELELSRRRDVFTLGAHAWALHAMGRDAEARAQIEKALAVGIKDARLLYHAGVIAARAGDADAARRYLDESLHVNESSDVAADARQERTLLGSQKS
jgi:tetratricopeptide (TPR) repeat protein